MKLQSASRKELTRIAIGTGICDCLMIAVLFLLSQFGIGTFPFVRIVLSALCGSVIAIATFAVMCLTVQSAVGVTDQKKMKAKFQLSYNVRMIVQSAWVVAAFLISQIHFVAGAAPVLFPKLTILYLQATGKLFPPDQAKAPEEEAPAEDAPDTTENESTTK